jgi:hypothetical protein
MPLLYIHQTSCISPQITFPVAAIDQLQPVKKNKLEVAEPDYESIPPGLLRRMGKAIRMGVGSALPLLKQTPVDGIIIGTANGGMEDCIKFLNQIIDYDEGRLTPGNFVGSTPNAIAAQLGLLTGNKNYNITHVQSGLSFENALLDAAMLIADNNESAYLVGGLDEISDYNYNIDWLGGWYKMEAVDDSDFYNINTKGSIAGEGSAMFIVNNKNEHAVAQLERLHFFHTNDASEVAKRLSEFIGLQQHQPAIFITAENGDGRYTDFDIAVESLMSDNVTVARYKHMCGEFATASAFSCWLACEIIKKQSMPQHMIKRMGTAPGYDSILIYNRYKENQHSFMLVGSTGTH